MSRPVRGRSRRTGSSKPIAERVRGQLEVLTQMRRASCEHVFRRDPNNAQRFVCMDCGATR